MLVLGRKIDQSIIIDKTIILTVIKYNSKSMVISIDEKLHTIDKLSAMVLNINNDKVNIVYLGYQHGQTKIGFDAPMNINIIREELRDK